MNEADANKLLGTTWPSKDGEREVVGVGRNEQNELRLAIKTEGSRLHELIEPGFLPRLIKLDEQDLRRRVAVAKGAAAEAPATFDDRGFFATMTQLKANRAKATLSRSIRHNGTVSMTGQMVITAVAAGARVQSMQHGRVLMFPTGSFLDEKQVTKIALDFAEHLATTTTPKRKAPGVTIRYGRTVRP
jgi:hypothetical protein